jgi:hypothetical protein
MEPQVLIFAGAGLVSLIAFTTLILVPAIGSFGRGWEKATAAALSVIVLVSLIGIGAAIGAAVVYYWNDLSRLFG